MPQPDSDPQALPPPDWGCRRRKWSPGYNFSLVSAMWTGCFVTLKVLIKAHVHFGAGWGHAEPNSNGHNLA